MQFSSRNFSMGGLGNAAPMGRRVNGWGRKDRRAAWSWNGDGDAADPRDVVDDNDLEDAATAPATTPDMTAAPSTATVTSGQAIQAKAELGRMRRALRKWLKYRGINDQVAAGAGDTLPKPLLGRPGVLPPSPAVMALRLAQQRPGYEAQLATQLFHLLSEVFDPSSLPSPDVNANPAAAVQLAQIAISGKLPAEAQGPGAQGLAAWVWPVVIVVGALAIVAMTAIKSSADDAANQEQIACIEAGKCTDSGFWLKVGAIAVVGWLAWDKMGLGEAVTGIFTKKRRA